ncbi:hypothetical protein QCA50_016972 [Cerrena zonata]|uniref:Uncharacterized protein n=1 Tax=Cerrena zonata TaxID=2478898 RepID=A0AAW0FRQ8_9APHY
MPAPHSLVIKNDGFSDPAFTIGFNNFYTILPLNVHSEGWNTKEHNIVRMVVILDVDVAVVAAFVAVFAAFVAVVAATIVAVLFPVIRKLAAFDGAVDVSEVGLAIPAY